MKPVTINIARIVFFFLVSYFLVFFTHFLFYIYFDVSKGNIEGGFFSHIYKSLAQNLNPRYVLMNLYFLRSLHIPALLCLAIYTFTSKSLKSNSLWKKWILYLILLVGMYIILASYNLILQKEYKKVIFTFFQNYGEKYDHSKQLIIHYFIGNILFSFLYVFCFERLFKKFITRKDVG